MLPPPMIRDWASKLIASEVDAESPSAQKKLATLRVYENIRRQFCAPVGVDAFQALASRALSLARSQFPELSAVEVTANGGLRGLGDAESGVDTDSDSEVGIVLIAQLLRLFISLLGEASTVRLIEGIPHNGEVKAELTAKGKNDLVTGVNYLGPFEDILVEADQLRDVSERLETLSNAHAGVEELMSVAGNIRNIAKILDVYTLIRSKAGASKDSVLMPPTNGYIN